MKYIILTIFLAVFKESYSLKPEIQKYDSFMKDFEATGRQLKQEKNKEMNSLIVKREDQNMDVTTPNPDNNEKMTLAYQCLDQMPKLRGKDLEKLTPMETGMLYQCMNQKYENVTNKLLVTEKQCDALKVLMGSRSEFEDYIPNALYPSDFPKIKNDIYAKCIVALTLQTGPLAEECRNILSKHNLTVSEYCNLGITEVHSPHSGGIHIEALPESCYTIEVYEDVIKHHPALHDYFTKGIRRHDIISALLEMIVSRIKYRKNSGVASNPDSPYRCIFLSNFPFFPKQEINMITENGTQPNGTRGLQYKRIIQHFNIKEVRANIKKICETKRSKKAGGAGGDVIIEFPKYQVSLTLAKAFLQRVRTVDDFKIGSKIIKCPDESLEYECDDENVWESNLFKQKNNANV